MTKLCPNCKLPDNDGVHDHPDVCLGAQQEAMTTLLHNIGNQAKCSGCKASIYWVRHKNNKYTPYDPSGLNHFISCPVADRFSTRHQPARQII